MYAAKIILDSVNPVGERLTTWELCYPRFVHAELMTHRVFSRNSSSSRAIPIAKMIEQVMTDPAMPVWWGKNQPGMQAKEELPLGSREMAKLEWLHARDAAVEQALKLAEMGAHKQIVNRLVEPWMWITVIVSATSFTNWFSLRCHEDAQPEIKRLADMMAAAYRENAPVPQQPGEWHLPYTGFDGDEIHAQPQLVKLSVGRCARVSYLTHDGLRDVYKDFELHDKLQESGHWSPFEHQAVSRDDAMRYGNFHGWFQYRKMFEGEERQTFPWES